MPEVTRTPVRAIAARIVRVRRRVTDAGQEGLMNSCVSCRSRIFIWCAMVSIEIVRLGKAIDQRIRVECERKSHCHLLLVDRMGRHGSARRRWSVESRHHASRLLRGDRRTERKRPFLFGVHVQSVLGPPRQRSSWPSRPTHAPSDSGPPLRRNSVRNWRPRPASELAESITWRCSAP